MMQLLFVICAILSVLFLSEVIVNPTLGVEKNIINLNIEEIDSQQIDKNILPNVDNNTDKVLKKGTLAIEDVEIPITYEKSGNFSIFEGDIILSNEIVEGRAAIDRFIISQPWTNGIIPVAIHPDLQDKQRVMQALRDVMGQTAIVFKPLEITESNEISDPNYVIFSPHPTDCSSYIGMKGGGQIINVADWCAKGNLIHEIGHLIGLWHEQTRCDRDQYIDVVYENIDPRLLSQFSAICDPNIRENYLSPISFGKYDYCSILHYGRYAASINNEPTMIPKNQIIGCDDIGQRESFSKGDIQAIFYIYPFLE